VTVAVTVAELEVILTTTGAPSDTGVPSPAEVLVTSLSLQATMKRLAVRTKSILYSFFIIL
jgi:hypothetical protein